MRAALPVGDLGPKPVFAIRAITNSRGGKVHRGGVAAVEFAVCFPVLLFILLGLWEVGRITEVQQVMWNSARSCA